MEYLSQTEKLWSSQMFREKVHSSECSNTNITPEKLKVWIPSGKNLYNHIFTFKVGRTEIRRPCNMFQDNILRKITLYSSKYVKAYNFF